ncbi:MAG: M20/M25/M40 family metallo-hydrolase [Candidatus Micrarchaeota archaeon]|nr:M20/M25/M40 family metallo-hydrolase [Candidatus Micrarchaeota archaeon]
MDDIALLEEAVSINSVSGNEKEFAIFVEKQLQAASFKTKRIRIEDGRFNIVGERGKEGKPLLFYGHLDTVPPYGKWSFNPFKLRKKDGRLYGLGVFDMKAGVCAIIRALQSQQESDRAIKVAFCVDEENISEGAFEVLKSGLLADVEAIITGEIASSGKCLGPRQIVLGRRGRCVLEIRVPGASAHGAQDKKGVNAINEAARLIEHLREMESFLGSHPLLPAPSQFVRKINAETTSLSVPELAVVELDRHLVIPQTPESALAQTKKFISSLYKRKIFRPIDGKKIEVGLKPRKTPYLAPYITDPKSQIVKIAACAVKKHAGKPVFAYGNSVADENVFALSGAPVIGIGPMGGNEHQADEWITARSYKQMINIFSEIIKTA